MCGTEAWRSMVIGEQLLRQARMRPNAMALVCGETRRTYGELRDRAQRLANGLRKRGVAKDDRVLLLTTNSVEMVESYLAIVLMGAIAVPVNFRLAPPEVAHIIRDSEPKLLIADRSTQSIMDTASALASCQHIPRIAIDRDSALRKAFDDYEEVIRFEEADYSGGGANDHDIAFIMYTSGTTGRPKGAMLSHFNLMMNTVHMFIELGIDSRDKVWLAGLPLFHIGGLNGILPYLLVGGTAVILPSGQFDPSEAVSVMETEKVTSCYFVPTQWQAICSLPDIKTRQLGLLRISWGASIAPAAVLDAIADRFPNVPAYNIFGQTEMSSMTCVMRADLHPEKQGAIGRPIANLECRVVDDGMNDVAAGQVGEIVYRGPTVFQGYWRMAEASREAFEGGWFHSGDLVRADDDGFYHVVDRKKDMIISGGENIYCSEVEAAIADHPGVADVAVVGVPHEKWVETPAAVIVPRDPTQPPSDTDIIVWCAGRLASFKKPSKVFVIDALPRNASGKVLKNELRATYG